MQIIIRWDVEADAWLIRYHNDHGRLLREYRRPSLDDARRTVAALTLAFPFAHVIWL